MSREAIDAKKEEVITACGDLYDREGVKGVTIQKISFLTGYPRTTIYHHFRSNEEAIIGFLNREYENWISDIRKIYNENSTLTKTEFAEKLARSLEPRRIMLKILSTNICDVERKSRMERIVNLNKSYRTAMILIRKCLDKFFPEMTQQDKYDFVYVFFPFMQGIYFYAELSEKQRKAMEEAKVPFKLGTIYETTYRATLIFLKQITGE